MKFSDLHPMWRERLSDMVKHVTWDGQGFSDVGHWRIAAGWPLRGTARFTRLADGQRFKAYLTKRKWKCVPV